MTVEQQEKLQAELEALVDQYSLSDVVDSLVGVCIDKCEHLKSNWQDGDAAKQWYRDGRKLANVVIKLTN